ncbi:hypothetical protein ACFY19_20815 [Streptosporangium saharense]
MIPALSRLADRVLRRLAALLRPADFDGYDVADWGFDDPRTEDLSDTR